MASRITIVIAACGQPALLKRTLTSLAACERPTELVGVIVVENGKRSGLEDVVRSFPSDLGFRHLFSEPGNQSLAQNVALEQIDGGLAVFTDDDVQWHPQALLAYRDGARGIERGEFYGGPVEPEFEGPPPPEWMRPYFPKTVQGYRHTFTEKTQIDGPEFIGPNFAAFVNDLREIGGIDTRLGPGCAAGCPGAESDAQERLLAHGMRGFYLPGALVRHFVRRHCTEPAWVFDRAYRTGVAWGIRRASQPGFGPLRYAKTAYDLLHERLRGARRHWRGGEQGRFIAQYLASRARGRWHGLRLGRRRSSWIGGAEARRAG